MTTAVTAGRYVDPGRASLLLDVGFQRRSWKPSPVNLSNHQVRTDPERLLDVQYVVEGLRDVYTDEGIDIWLRARNRNFGGQRPIDLVTAGDIDTVLREAQRLAGAM